MRTRNISIWFLSKRILAVILLILIVIGLYLLKFLLTEYEIKRVVIYSTKYKAGYTLTNKKVLQQFQTALANNNQTDQIRKNIKAEYLLRVERKIGKKEYIIVNSQLLYDIKKKTYIKLNSIIANEINKSLAKINEVSPFGALIHWEDIDKYLPKYAKAKIRDLGTGLSFNVQRRAGRSHADVQPLTKEDTAIFKKIYEGNWSWRRRAAVVEVENKKIAASINGMPHGGGAITGNNFPGHFCLHFLDSRVHLNNQVDPAHQIMVWKSAGRFDEYVANQIPENLPNLFFIILDQQDEDLMNLIMEEKNKSVMMFFRKYSRAKLDTSNIDINKKEIKSFQGTAKIIDLEQREKKIKFDIKLIPNKNFKGWLIKSVTLSEN